MQEKNPTGNYGQKEHSLALRTQLQAGMFMLRFVNQVSFLLVVHVLQYIKHMAQLVELPYALQSQLSTLIERGSTQTDLTRFRHFIEAVNYDTVRIYFMEPDCLQIDNIFEMQEVHGISQVKAFYAFGMRHVLHLHKNHRLTYLTGPLDSSPAEFIHIRSSVAIPLAKEDCIIHISEPFFSSKACFLLLLSKCSKLFAAVAEGFDIKVVDLQSASGILRKTLAFFQSPSIIAYGRVFILNIGKEDSIRAAVVKDNQIQLKYICVDKPTICQTKGTINLHSHGQPNIHQIFTFTGDFNTTTFIIWRQGSKSSTITLISVDFITGAVKDTKSKNFGVDCRALVERNILIVKEQKASKVEIYKYLIDEPFKLQSSAILQEAGENTLSYDPIDEEFYYLTETTVFRLFSQNQEHIMDYEIDFGFANKEEELDTNQKRELYKLTEKKNYRQICCILENKVQQLRKIIGDYLSKHENYIPSSFFTYKALLILMNPHENQCHIAEKDMDALLDKADLDLTLLTLDQMVHQGRVQLVAEGVINHIVRQIEYPPFSSLANKRIYFSMVEQRFLGFLKQLQLELLKCGDEELEKQLFAFTCQLPDMERIIYQFIRKGRTGYLAEQAFATNNASILIPLMCYSNELTLSDFSDFVKQHKELNPQYHSEFISKFLTYYITSYRNKENTNFCKFKVLNAFPDDDLQTVYDYLLVSQKKLALIVGLKMGKRRELANNIVQMGKELTKPYHVQTMLRIGGKMGSDQEMQAMICQNMGIDYQQPEQFLVNLKQGRFRNKQISAHLWDQLKRFDICNEIQNWDDLKKLIKIK